MCGGNGVNVAPPRLCNRISPTFATNGDFNNDGIFDTAPSTNPMVSNIYPDEVRVDSRVRAKGSRSAESTVTFQTLRCPWACYGVETNQKLRGRVFALSRTAPVQSIKGVHHFRKNGFFVR